MIPSWLSPSTILDWLQLGFAFLVIVVAGVVAGWMAGLALNAIL